MYVKYFRTCIVKLESKTLNFKYFIWKNLCWNLQPPSHEDLSKKISEVVQVKFLSNFSNRNLSLELSPRILASVLQAI